MLNRELLLKCQFVQSKDNIQNYGSKRQTIENLRCGKQRSKSLSIELWREKEKGEW